MNETLKMSGQLAIDSDNDNDTGNILENSNFLSALGGGAAQALVNKILNAGNSGNNSSDSTSNLLSSLTASLSNSKNSYTTV